MRFSVHTGAIISQAAGRGGAQSTRPWRDIICPMIGCVRSQDPAQMLLLGEGHLRWILRAYAPDHWTNDIPPRARALCAAPSGRLANNGTCVYRKPHPQ